MGSPKEDLAGHEGFGYDPIFYYPPMPSSVTSGCITSARLTAP